MNNVIPPMNSFYARHWIQPDPSQILITDEDAVMSQSVFDNLHEYSSSTPTGVYSGKMWKARHDSEEWRLHWYGKEFLHKGFPSCYVETRIIQIMDWQTIMGIKQEKL